MPGPRSLLRSLVLAAALAPALSAQAAGDRPPERAVRRDVPLTNAVRGAYEAGTRDSTGVPGADYWQLRTDYSIDARLDPGTHSISGSETIRLHNTSPFELSEILLRLDHNILRATVPRGSSVPAETTDGMIVTRITVDGMAVALHPPATLGRGAAQPRGLVAHSLDQTVAVLSLETPIAARSVATVEIDWHTKLPGGPKGLGHRMTQRWGDTLFQPTQWFPRISKYDDLRGWDRSVYLGPAEFYNKLRSLRRAARRPGRLDSQRHGSSPEPRGGAHTGRPRPPLQGPRLGRGDDDRIGGRVRAGSRDRRGERLVWHFVADMVNDFAWATAENFVWRATRATIPGRGPVPIHMVFLPGRAYRFEDAGPITRHALEFYSDLWAPYPFPQLTLQDGPSAGMEYPMVINSNQSAADHETAHQWWPMMVGTNET